MKHVRNSWSNLVKPSRAFHCVIALCHVMVWFHSCFRWWNWLELGRLEPNWTLHAPLKKTGPRHIFASIVSISHTLFLHCSRSLITLLSQNNILNSNHDEFELQVQSTILIWWLVLQVSANRVNLAYDIKSWVWESSWLDSTLSSVFLIMSLIWLQFVLISARVVVATRQSFE